MYFMISGKPPFVQHRRPDVDYTAKTQEFRPFQNELVKKQAFFANRILPPVSIT